MASYFYITLRKASGGQFVDDVDLAAPKYLEVPSGQLPAPNRQISQTAWLKKVVSSFHLNEDGLPTGDIAFFVHGYNNTLDNIAQRQDKIHNGLNNAGFQCLTISFDWPSDDKIYAYLDDAAHAKTTAIQLVKAAVFPFVKSLRPNCDVNVHVLGHSMGAFVIREAFDHADDDGSVADKIWTANQLVLFAGDASADKFSATNTETESMFRHCYRLTNYFSGYDEALQVSNVKRLGVSPRVGRVGLPPDAPAKAVNVNCSNYFGSTYGNGLQTALDPVLTHSWYFDDPKFMQDLALTLAGKIDRTRIPTRSAPNVNGTQSLL